VLALAACLYSYFDLKWLIKNSSLLGFLYDITTSYPNKDAFCHIGYYAPDLYCVSSLSMVWLCSQVAKKFNRPLPTVVRLLFLPYLS
jgi:hypothetical protein